MHTQMSRYYYDVSANNLNLPIIFNVKGTRYEKRKKKEVYEVRLIAFLLNLHCYFMNKRY